MSVSVFRGPSGDMGMGGDGGVDCGLGGQTANEGKQPGAGEDRHRMEEQLHLRDFLSHDCATHTDTLITPGLREDDSLDYPHESIYCLLIMSVVYLLDLSHVSNASGGGWERKKPSGRIWKWVVEVVWTSFFPLISASPHSSGFLLCPNNL